MKPFIPFLEYAILQDYIENVLCVNKDKPELNCHGKCHLNKQLKKANDAETKPKQTSMPRVELKIFSIISDDKNDLKPVTHKKPIFSLYSFPITEFFSDIPTPPPKAIC